MTMQRRSFLQQAISIAATIAATVYCPISLDRDDELDLCFQGSPWVEAEGKVYFRSNKIIWTPYLG